MADETEIQVAENVPEERPSWLPSNFDKPEDLAKSYTHSVSKITEQGQELAALRSQIEEIQASQNQVHAQQYNNDLEAQLIEQMESGDGRAALGVQAFLIQQALEAQRAEFDAKFASLQPQQSTELVVDYAERKIAQEFPDWPEYRSEVGKAVAANPRISKALEGETNPDVIAGHLKDAYMIAKFQSGQSASSDALQAVSDLSRQVKNAAQTMSGGSSAETPESYFDQVKAAKVGTSLFG